MTDFFSDFKYDKFRFRNVLQNEYELDNIISMSTLPGGHSEEETWMIVCETHKKYIAKIIQTSSNFKNLETILIFQNYLHSKLDYPCAQILLNSKEELIIGLGNKNYLFVQTYLNGHVPTSNELNESYLSQMGTLLGQLRLASHTFMSNVPTLDMMNYELTNQWWLEQNDRLHRRCLCLTQSEIQYLYSILSECRQECNGKVDQFELGLIHHDFQTSNTLYDDNVHQIHVIDFGEASYTYSILDLATTLFLFVTNGIDDYRRLLAFLTSYQQQFQLNQQEIEMLDVLTRLKLTINFIGDCINVKTRDEFEHSSWLQSCSKWIRYLHHENRTFFLSMILQQTK